MKQFILDFQETTRGRPFVRAYLILVGVVIPLVVIGGSVAVTVLNLSQRRDLGRQARDNCERAASIADFIRDVTRGSSNSRATVALHDLERKLRSIGMCPM